MGRVVSTAGLLLLAGCNCGSSAGAGDAGGSDSGRASDAGRSPGDGGSANDAGSTGDGGPTVCGAGTWVQLDAGVSVDLVHVWARSVDEVYLRGAAAAFSADSAALVWNGSGFADLFDAGFPNTPLWGVGGEMWTGGNEIVSHWDGNAWTAVPMQDDREVGDVWGSGPSDVWFVGYNYCAHWDGGALWHVGDWAVGWTQGIDMGGGVGGSGPEDAWTLPTAMHWDGQLWAAASGPPANDLWLAGPGAGWAVGSGGALSFYDGGTWGAFASPTGQSLMGVWGRTADDVFAVGASGTVLHWDGTSWALQSTTTSATLTSVSGAGCDVWAVGTGGTVLRQQR